MKKCKTCEHQVNGNYCANCGTPISLKRIDKDYIVNEISSVLNLNKGIFYTIKELLIRPGKTIQKFILEDRNRLVKPIVFIIITSFIYSILVQIFHFEDAYVYYENDKQNTTAVLFEWVQNNYGYGNLIMAIFIAFWIKILFRKYNNNFYETLILLCFIMGVGMLFLSIFGLIQGVFQIKVMDYGGMLFFVYATWAIGQYFNRKKWTSYAKAALAYVLGMFTFSFVIVLVGGLIDKLG